MYVVATTVEPVFRVALGYPFSGRLDDRLQGVAGAGLGRAQPGFSLLKASSMGLKSGEYGGRYSRRALRAATHSAWPAALWAGRLSGTTMSPGTSVRPGTCCR